MVGAAFVSKDGSKPVTALAPRARAILDGLFADFRAQLEVLLPRITEATELALTEPMPSGRPEDETTRLASLQSLTTGSVLFTRRMLDHLHTAFQSPIAQPTRASEPVQDTMPLTLSLVDDDADDDNGVLMLENTAGRLGSRNSLALQLLGQRFGVLARAPAFEPENLPLGPQVLCQGLSHSIDELDLPHAARLQLFRQFEKALVDAYPALLDACNAYLVRAGILPFLNFVPVRATPRGLDSPAAETAEARGGTPGLSPEAQAGARMRALQRAPIDASFSTLQALLQRRRAVLAKLRPSPQASAERDKSRTTLPHDEVLDALKRLRANNTRAESVQEYRQILLAQARQQHGRGVALPEPDEDSFDLLALFLAQIQRGLRRSSPGHSLMERLFLPMALSALRDPTFFTDTNHPARELLDAVSLSGARWLAEDDLDPQWLGLLQRAVTAVQRDGDGSADVFAEANRTLQSGMQTLIRKAEMAERRQVEAARGRERLAIARMCAGEAVEHLLAGRSLPPYHDTFIQHAWVDVLSLAHLRGGDASEAWQSLMDATRHIINAGLEAAAGPLPAASLERITEALEQVGYHVDDATAIVQALDGHHPDPALAARRERLLDKLGARARLGEDALSAPQRERDLQHPEEQAAYEQLRSTNIPAWIEYTGDPEHPLRRRLAWIGEASGQALLVNRRGLRAEEESLISLARKLAAGSAQLLDRDASPARSAWEETLDSLLPLAGDAPQGQGSGSGGSKDPKGGR